METKAKNSRCMKLERMLERLGIFRKREFEDGETAYIIRERFSGIDISECSFDIVNVKGFNRFTGKYKVYVRRGIFGIEGFYEHVSAQKLQRNYPFPF